MNSAKHLVNVFWWHQTRDSNLSEFEVCQSAEWCKWLYRSSRKIHIIGNVGGASTLKGYDLSGTTTVRVRHNTDISGRQMRTIDNLVIVFCKR